MLAVGALLATSGCIWVPVGGGRGDGGGHYSGGGDHDEHWSDGDHGDHSGDSDHRDNH